MSPDPNKKMLRQFQCRESLWQKFEQMAKELECSVDYLINDAMKQYARQRGYAGSAATSPRSDTNAPPPSSVVPSALQPAQPAAPVQAPTIAQGTPGSGAHAMPGSSRQGSGAHPLPAPAMTHAPKPPTTTSGSGAHGTPTAQSARYGIPPTLPGPGGSPGQVLPPASRIPAQVPPPAPPAPGAKRVGPPPLAVGAVVAPPAVPPGATRIPAPPPPTPAGHHPRTLSSAKLPVAQTVPTPTPKQLQIRYQGQSFIVNKEKFIIGRGKQMSDLTIKDPNVSRQHAMIEFDGNSYCIVDLGSTNGLEYLGQRVARKVLADGDIIRICDHELSFQYR